MGSERIVTARVLSSGQRGSRSGGPAAGKGAGALALTGTVLIAALLSAIACTDSSASASISVPLDSLNSKRVVTDSATALVIRARAFDRAENRDSARLLYDASAKALPQIADWLNLRAAGVTASKADRESYYGRLKTSVAKERIDWTEAFALERFGEISEAATKYREVGGMVNYFRLKLALAKDSVAQGAVRTEMLDWISRASSSDQLRGAMELFDTTFTTVSPGEHLLLARSSWRAGVSRRTTTSYQQALAARLGNDRDYYNYGLALARLKSHAPAILALNRVRTPANLAASAQYQRARSYIAMGNTSQGRTVLRNISTQFPADTSAASALMLLADLATDDQRDTDARSTLATVVKRFPGSRHAPTALYRGGLITYLNGQMRAAAAQFDSLARLYPSSDEASSARYWAGRAYAAVGDSTTARARWTETIEKTPSTYYAVVAAKRLNRPILANPLTPNAYPTVAEVDAAHTRVAMLRDVGMDVEMKLEWDEMYKRAGESPERLVATAHAFVGTEQASRSINLGIRALKESGATPQNYRLMYPVLEHQTIISSAKRNGLDPILIASLIRQESSYNPRAVSPVGALGLMQLMPDVGRNLAKMEGITDWSNEKLFDPAINIRLGTRHLKGLVRSYPQIEKVLAAYNAGESRVVRWSTKRGANDPEMFTERIPFVETRDYVRLIVRNHEFYKELYRW